jgi:hypothetical protein
MTWDVYIVAKRPRQGTSTTTDLAILGGPSKVGGLANLAGTPKERNTGA